MNTYRVFKTGGSYITEVKADTLKQAVEQFIELNGPGSRYLLTGDEHASIRYPQTSNFISDFTMYKIPESRLF